ncbi:inorganic diphosphatase [Winogradskyella sp. 3972H.M.0a.05]|uniref:inorganic diphosphatase n=1 Tax=Winogradskyella sp. 3972H.M.0a.05 TaxID=2950277 RepID=UPI00339B632D
MVLLGNGGYKITPILLIIVILFSACKNNNSIDYYSYQTFSDEGNPYAIIEIPAGTNKKLEYNSEANSFDVDKENGKERIIDFLPYPGNYGFIPSTYSNTDTGGDGDALDVLVLCESLKTGAIVKIIPLGVLKLIDNGEIDSKIIAIPFDESNQVLSAENYLEFSKKYPEVKTIIELWFLNYNPNDPSTISGWGDEIEALSEIKNNLKR